MTAGCTMFIAAVLTAALSASPAIRAVDAPQSKGCDDRLYYLPFPPAENGHSDRPPVIDGAREKNDSFVVTVERITCPGRRLPGVQVDDPSQRKVTWRATVKPTEADQVKPPMSYVKGPTFKMGPDGETIVEKHK